jgi:hypothetical protein
MLPAVWVASRGRLAVDETDRQEMRQADPQQRMVGEDEDGLLAGLQRVRREPVQPVAAQRAMNGRGLCIGIACSEGPSVDSQ